MKFFYLIILLLSVFLTLQNKQNGEYWENAPVNGLPIYAIYFTDRTGYAVSYNDNLFITNDNGFTWHPEDISELSNFKAEEFIWSGEIRCSAMKTTDNGINWVPCSFEMQEHFCRVYLRDPNTGFQAAEEFLKTVSNKIFENINNNGIELLENHPQQCTAYYSSKDEGWVLGWCLKDFITHKGLAELK